ncbi:MAG: hypothetical protein COV45_02645 [Deltaproteobacteria bacterium CG11_big_fil_rev_8_21_14_0_20_47_16]|nr:MAG: hypothetical protein COV45_02645 [Deltaproteobacteria bacterium CG11_big_fil_rev_8_21_14_0_20_47_16]
MRELDPGESKLICDGSEDEAKLEFEKRGYKVAPIDKSSVYKKNGRKRPDFLCTKQGSRLIIEVKTVISAGRSKGTGSQETGVPLSVFRKTAGPICFSDDDPIRKLNELLENAQKKFDDFSFDFPSFEGCPYLVCIFDQWAYCPTQQILKDGFFECNDVSAVLIPERNRHYPEIIKAMTDLERGQYFRGEIDIPKTFEWKVVKNRNAKIPISLDLLQPCIDIYP